MLITYDEIFNPLKAREQDFIDVFVEFYGEEHRKRITDSILSTKFFFVSSDPYNEVMEYIEDKKYWQVVELDDKLKKYLDFRRIKLYN